MSILGNLCKTKSLPVLSKSSRYAVMIDDLPLPPHFLSEQTRARRTRNYNTISSKSTKFRSLEDFFISTLVAAGSCKNHCGGQSGLRRVVKRPYDDLVKRNGVSYFRRGYASKIAGHQRLARPGDWHRKQAHSSAELKEIVNTYHADSDHDSYHSGSDLWSLSKENSIKTSDITSGPRHFPLARRMVLSPEEEDLPPYTKRVVLSPVDHRHALRMRHLNKLLHMKFGRISLDKLWDSYQALQTPRLRYLTENTIRRLFAHLAWVEYKHKQSAHDRFFALLEECLGERITVQADEWNSAIAFAGRQERDVSIDSIRAAVETWMRMEEHGVTATHGTFNILFDLAVKAGRFALADTIYNELISRGLRLNRFFRSSLIYYAGMRGDGDAVRQAFRDLVNAGEIVDTVVMNCVIKSLINAGEPAAAENVFIKMKRLHEQNLGTKTPTDWQDLKALGHRLDIEAQRLQEERTAHESSFFGSEFSSQDRKEEVQRSTPIAPNERTYRILITYHAQTSGSIDRIRELLAEMDEEGLNIHGSIYYHLFGGYWQHGGYATSLWTKRSLEVFWREFLQRVKPGDRSKNSSQQASEVGTEDEDGLRDESMVTELERPPYFMRDLVLNALAAFYKCAGRKRMLEVWADVQRRWRDMTAEDRARIKVLVDKFVQEDSIYM